MCVVVVQPGLPAQSPVGSMALETGKMSFEWDRSTSEVSETRPGSGRVLFLLTNLAKMPRFPWLYQLSSIAGYLCRLPSEIYQDSPAKSIHSAKPLEHAEKLHPRL